ncbi:MAG TPA: hypothetical protein VNA11_14625 [Pseudonocardia sp.]|nr:hypothetical protein [Pseudonocardia sp.]
MGVAEVGGTGRRCALPGCDQPIDDVVGRPQRLYCTSAHRLAARQARRRAAQRERQTEAFPVAANESGWAALNEAALAIRAAYAEQQWLAAISSAASKSAAEGPGDGAAREQPAEHELPEWARQAGLASQLTRAGFWPGWAARFVTTPGRHRTPGPAGRRRTMAVLGAAGIVAGGYALTSLPVGPGPDRPTPVQLPPTPTVDQRWAARAQVTMSSLDEQLEVIERAEREWRRLRPTEPLPSALEQRKALLNRRRTALVEQLDAVRSLDRARAELARSERALNETDPAAPPRQRQQRERERDERRREVDALAGPAATAVRAPLPDDGERTTEITERVRDDVRSAARAPTEPSVAAPPTEVPDPGPGEPAAPDGQRTPIPPVDGGGEPGPDRGGGPPTSPGPAPAPDQPGAPATDLVPDRGDPARKEPGAAPPAEGRADAGRTERRPDAGRSADGEPKAGAKRAHEAERRSPRSRSVGERTGRAAGATTRSDPDRRRSGRSNERSSPAASCDDHDEDRRGAHRTSARGQSEADRSDSDEADRKRPESKRTRLARAHHRDHRTHRAADRRDDHHHDGHRGDGHRGGHRGDEHHRDDDRRDDDRDKDRRHNRHEDRHGDRHDDRHDDRRDRVHGRVG